MNHKPNKPKTNKIKINKSVVALLLVALLSCMLAGCSGDANTTGNSNTANTTGNSNTANTAGNSNTANTAGNTNTSNTTATKATDTTATTTTIAQKADANYTFETLPLEREGQALHLESTKSSQTQAGKSTQTQAGKSTQTQAGKSSQTQDNKSPQTQTNKNILLIHGVTYSSHEFDIKYHDYSLVRKLADEGYNVWRLDIAGFGQSASVEDGFKPDSNYAAEDVGAAVDAIVAKTGQDKIDVLGWSWGTVTTSRFVAAHPEHVNKLVLYAPILSGLGETEVNEPFHHNTWEHAADDFQRTATGTFDYSITDPVLIEMWCSSCWHFDGESSPNGGRRDICVSKDTKLIDLTKISVPTLVICGSKDPYLNYDLVNATLKDLPSGSELEVIEGGSHVVMAEKPYYHEFQDKLVKYLAKN